MKYMFAALVGLGLLSTGFAQAKTEETKKTQIIHKKHSPYKKTSKPHAKPAKVQSHRMKAKPKTQVYKNVTKRAVNPAATTAATAVAPVAAAPLAASTNTAATTKTTEPTAYQKFENFFGLGTDAAATTAAATAASVGGHHRAAGYHTGPRKEKWNHKFESYWGNRGFEVGVNPNGHWVFGSFRPKFWEENYPVYWKDVVGPLYRESDEYKKTLSK